MEEMTNTNNSYIPPPTDPKFLKFIVLPGNNSKLIKDAMLRRKHKWVETSAND